MSHADTIREELIHMVRRVPFTPFAVVMESGERAVVAHQENIAFDPEPNGRQRLFIIAEPLVIRSTLSAVSSVVELDRGQVSGE